MVYLDDVRHHCHDWLSDFLIHLQNRTAIAKWITIDMRNGVPLKSPLVEASPTEGVTESDRRGWIFLVAIQVGMSICIPLFALGGQLAQHRTLPQLARDIILSCTLMTIIGIFSGAVGVKSRQPTAFLVQHTFGIAGSRLVAVILALTLFGWFGVQTEVFVQSVLSICAAAFGHSPPRLPITIVSGLVMGITAVVGAKALGKVAFLAVPLLLAALAPPLFHFLTSGHIGETIFHSVPGASYSDTRIISIIVGGHMLTVAVLPDVSRLLRTQRDNAIAVVVSLLVALPALLMLSSALSAFYQSADLIQIMIGAGVGIPALLVIFLATWTSNDKNLYESALSLGVIFPNVDRWKLTVISMVLGVALAAVGIFGHFVTFLVILGVAVAPMVGVYLTDFAVDARRYSSPPDCRIIRALPCFAWFFGLLLSLMTLPVGDLGLGWFEFTGIPAMDALLAASAVYLLGRLFSRISFQ
ncbi:MAG: cytosine permease [Pseudomonas sp.]